MAPDFRPAIETLGWYHTLNGDHLKASEAFDQLPRLAGLEYAGASARGYAYAKLGRLEDVQRMIELLEARAEAQPDVTLDVDFAIVYEGMGRRADALACLERALERRMGALVNVATWPAWQEAQSDPGFQALLDRIGVPGAVAV